MALSGGLQLAFTLESSAQSWSRRAILSHAESDDRETAIAVGLCLEHLAKFTLLKRDPGALAHDRVGRPGSLLLGKGIGHQSVRDMGDVRTVQLAPALKKAFDALGAGSPPPEDLDALVTARNSAFHLGYSHRPMAINALTAMARTLRVLLGGAQASASWIGIEPDFEDLLAELPVQDAVGIPPQPSPGWPPGDLSRAHIHARRFAAKRRWLDLAVRLQPNQLQLAADLAAGELPSPEAELRLCPTGSHFAWFEVGYEEDEDTDPDDNVVSRRRFLDRMDCPLCGLRLQGEDELAAVGVAEDFGYFVFEREE